MATEPLLTPTDSEALIPSSNYVRPPLVTANIISQSTSDPGRVRKGGGTLFLLFFDSCSACKSLGRKAIAGEHGKSTIPPNDAPNPPTMHTCRAVTASEHLLIGSRTAPHPDVRDEGSLESLSPAPSPAVHWAPPTYLRPGRLPARISVTRPCSVGTSHTPHKPAIFITGALSVKTHSKTFLVIF